MNLKPEYQAILLFVGLIALYFAAWAVYTAIIGESFVNKAFQPLWLVCIVIADALFSWETYRRAKNGQ